MPSRPSVVGLLLGVGCASAATAQVRSATLVAIQGGPAAGSTISTVNTPFVDNAGSVGFVASLADARRAIMRSTGGPAGVAWESSLGLPTALTGGESTMGISAASGFIYSPSADGRDAVYTQAGLLLAADDPAPGVPGRFITFCSRPRMTGSGTAVWVSGTAATQGGASSARVFYQNVDPSNPSLTTPLLASGDTFAPGLTVSASGIGFDYDISENGRRIHELLATGAPAASDECIWADGVLIAREGSPAPDGTNWGPFSGVAINNNGDTLFTADTTGPTNADQVLVLNGAIILREGDVVDGRTLGSAVSALAIDNHRNIVVTWTTPAETLYFRQPDGTTTALLAVGETIDTDGDGAADYTVTDFNASAVIGPGLDLADTGPVYLHVDLQPIGGGADLQAVIGVARPGGSACRPDYNGDGVLDPDDLADFIACYFSLPPCAQANYNSDAAVDPDDLADYIADYFAGCV